MGIKNNRNYKTDPSLYEDWLPVNERWRVAVAWRQCRWYPKILFSYIHSNGHGKDIEQEILTAVWESYNLKLSVQDTGKLTQKYLHVLFNSVGIRKRQNRWILSEWTGFHDDISKESLGMHWWADLIRIKGQIRAKNVRKEK